MIPDIPSISRYVERCFQDAFHGCSRKDGRDDFKNWKHVFRYTIIKSIDSEDLYLVPLIERCSSKNVKKRVEFRLERNLYHNFGVIYRGDKEHKFCARYMTEGTRINPILTQFLFCDKATDVLLDVFDCRTRSTVPFGYRKMVMKLYGYSEEEYLEYLKLKNESEKFNNFDKACEYTAKINLPNKYFTNFSHYEELYNETFGIPLGSYKTYESKGVTKL